MRIAATCVAAAGLAIAAAAGAEVTGASPAGFEVRESADIGAPAARVWAALARIGAWWDGEHTFSGDPANLAIELKAGGCWCESLAAHDARAEHMRVIYVKPPLAARLEGALGPLQTTGATGHMAWSLKEAGGRTAFALTYDVGGYARGGLAGWAKPVDQVLGREVARLKRYVETGAP